MKNIFILLFFSICFLVNAQDSFEVIEEKVNWEHSFESAKAIAKTENKTVLIFFTGSDWCGPCKNLVEDFFTSDKFKEIADKEFVLYEADFPRNKGLVSKSQKKDNSRLSNKYGINSYPTIVIIDEKEKVLGKMKGYNLMRETSYHYSFLDGVLKKVK
jgi:thioredoxin-related protein